MNMFKRAFVNLLVVLVVLLSCGLAQAVPVTIATFADPSMNAGQPLFTVGGIGSPFITGGWADTETGLTLQIPYSGHTYPDAFFTMTVLTYSGGITSSGKIKFYHDNQNINETPLIEIDFNSGHITPFGFGAMDMLYLDGVTVSGSEIGGAVLTDESFAFGFGNLAPIGGDWNNGYTATAAFTSSAAVPEPATIALLGTAGLCVFTRKKRSV